MRNLVLTSMAALVLATVPAAGQAPKAAPNAKTAAAVKGTWTAPRTPDGQPDLQGSWTNNTLTPLERPKELGAREFYTEAELADLIKKDQTRLALNEEEGR